MTPFHFRQSSFTITRGSADWIKLVAAIMIALHHYSQYVWTNHLSDSIIHHILCSQAGFIAVAIFFFLSGYGLMESEKKRHLAFGAFIKRRLLKVYVPVVLATALWLPASACLLGSDISHDIWYVLWDFNDSAMWFIEAILLMYVVFGIFIQLPYKNRTVLSMICLTVMTIVSIAICLAFIQGTFSILALPMFSIGVTASLCNDSARNMWKVYSSIIGWGAAIILFTGIWESQYAKYALLDYVFIFIFMLVFTMWSIDIRSKLSPMAGIVSFDLYLVHNKVLTIMKDGVIDMDIIAYCLCVAAATLVFHYIRKAVKV